ncbi:MAG: hypothetical protein QOC65_1558 [Sphingomonadales bacterium]|nr:hypothetical protein [Sphingomonadales bacterium]
MKLRQAEIIPFPTRAHRPAGLADLRFRRLVGEAAWSELPEPVRIRFSKRLGGGRTAIYTGEVVECRMSRVGFALAQLARLIGAPLPLARDCWLPAAVTVTEDPCSGGQLWTRIYGRRSGFPQVIHSAKRFCGSTGLEEYLGRGFGIALTARVESGALHFLSDHYFLSLGQLRLRLPRWLSPGLMTVSHIECGGGRFAFILSLVHPLFGALIRQTAMFDERFEHSEGAVS